MYGGFYGQGVVKNSPHQACSKLWLEHILSDEGALGYLEGGAMPARYQALVDAGKVTDEMKKNLPPDELISQIKFLTPAQIAAAKEVLAAQLGSNGCRRLSLVTDCFTCCWGSRSLARPPRPCHSKATAELGLARPRPILLLPRAVFDCSGNQRVSKCARRQQRQLRL